MLNFADELQFLGIEDRGERCERDGAAGIAGATASRDDAEPELDAGANESRDFIFGIGTQYYEGILDAPVGRISDV